MNTTIVSILAFAILFVVVKMFSQMIIRIILGVLVILLSLGFLYYKAWWPFQDNRYTLDYLANQYCREYDDEDICDCIIVKIKDDMASRFSNEELDELFEQRLQGAYALRKSQEATKDASMECLKARNAEDKYQKFLMQQIPLDNGIINMITNGTDSLSNKIKEKVDFMKDEKEGIDSKY